MPEEGWASEDLAEAHSAFRALLTLTDGRVRRPRIYGFLSSRFSRVRQVRACGVTLRQWMRHSDLREEVLQQSMVSLAERIFDGRIRYDDRGPSPFGGWLWRLWLSECSTALRATRPLWMAKNMVSGEEYLTTIPATDPDSHPARRAVALVLECRNPLYRAILIDWMEGTTIRESAVRRALSKSEVERLRRSAADELASHNDSRRPAFTGQPPY
jgi:hypothetical protein